MVKGRKNKPPTNEGKGKQSINNQLTITTMKKLLYLGLVCLLAILSACSDSKESELVPSEEFYFREPALLWGCSQEKVMEAMQDYQLLDSSGSSLTYQGKDSEVAYLYAFSSSYSTLSHVVVSFNLENKSNVLQYLRSHYLEINGDLDNPIFTDSSKSMFVTIVTDDLLYVTYMDREYMAR